MEVFTDLLIGFSVVFEPQNFFVCFLGAVVGTLTGVIPGLGPVGAMCLLFPLTFKLSAVTGIIMLAGIYYGAMYGGSITSILVNLPGEAASVVTCIDGYEMAKNGLAGPALGMAAFGSFIAGTVGIVFLMFLAPALAKVALNFGPPEYFAVMVTALSIVTYLASGSMINAWIMVFLGLILGIVGVDIFTGQERFTLGNPTFREGLDIAPVIMGIFGLGEIFNNIDEQLSQLNILKTKVKELFPSRQQWREASGSILRGTLLGFALGLIPGGGAIIASFAAYALEKKISKHPEKFGKGAIEGIAGPESANNAATSGAFIPMLALGIPSNVVMTILIGALLVHGVNPGPLLVIDHKELFWGIIASMYVGNVFLLILNVPLIPIWIKVLKVPYAILFPLILLFCIVGVYSINSNVEQIGIMLFFGVFGYFMKKCNFEGAPLAMAFILSPLMENAMKQSLKMSNGSFAIFFIRPIAGILIGIAILSILTSLSPFIRNQIKRMAS